MSCAINCNETELAHDAEDLVCLGAKPAGASEIVIYWCLDNITDITNPAETLAAIAAGEAILITDILFGNDVPTPTNGPKVTACGTPSVLYNTYPVSITDYSYNQTNAELYGALGNGRRAAAILAWDCQTNTNFPDTSRYYLPTSGGVTFAGGLVDPNNDDEVARFEVAGSFKGSVTIISTPAGIFS